jgi:hypothetical protein
VKASNHSVAIHAQGVQYRQRMQNDGDSVLVVRDAETVGVVAVDAEWLLDQHAARVDGVQVSQE